MIKRVVDVSERAYLHVQNRQLCVNKDGITVSKIATDDLDTSAPCDNDYTVGYHLMSEK